MTAASRAAVDVSRSGGARADAPSGRRHTAGSTMFSGARHRVPIREEGAA
ncbi:MAG: hypothetical protein PIR02_04565 [Microbacterium enclense]